LARRAADAPESIEPPEGAWQGVRQRIVGEGTVQASSLGEGEPDVVGHISAIPVRGARRFTVTSPWLVAAALVLVAGSSAVTALVLRRDGPSSGSSIAANASIRAVSLPGNIQASEREYLRTAEALRSALNDERGRLTPETVAIVERSLTIIESAIGEARAALVRDPASRELRDLWSRNHQQKLDLLRRATALVQRS
ncbi:MAG: hypothetical protein ABI877_11470, partial [Gemmatimonadaceae bacterium]